MNKQVNNESDCNKNLKVVNMEVPFEGWIPLTTVKTKVAKRKYNHSGYEICHTVKEFEAEYPFVDMSKIFFPKGHDRLCYYFDEDNLMIFTLCLWNNTFSVPVGQTLESVVSNRVNVLSDEMKKSPIDCYKSMLNGLKGDIRFEYLGKVIEKIGLFDGVYGVLMNLYSGKYYTITKATEVYTKDVMQHKTPMEHQRTAEKLKNLPDILTVYRGISETNRNEKEGYSWTLNENRAYYFAFGYRGNLHGRVVQGLVKKTDVIEYITNHHEDEIVVDPSCVYDMVEGKQVDFSVVRGLVYTLYGDFQRFEEMLKGVTFDAHSFYYGKDHTIRVLLLSLILFRYLHMPSSETDCFYDEHSYDEKLNKLKWPEECLSLDDEDLASLCMSVVYHDCKHTTDGEYPNYNDDDDENHGKRAATYYRCREKDWSPLVRFLIEYHSAPDDVIIAAIEADPELSESSDKVVFLLNILKDADTLDRVGFGMDMDKVDISKLRFPVSKTIVSAAGLLNYFEKVYQPLL